MQQKISGSRHISLANKFGGGWMQELSGVVFFCCFYVCKIDSLQVSLTKNSMDVMTKRSKLQKKKFTQGKQSWSTYLPWNRIPFCVLMLAFMLWWQAGNCQMRSHSWSWMWTRIFRGQATRFFFGYMWVALNISTYIYVVIPPYLPTGLPTYLPTYIRRYVHTCIHACMHACMPTRTHIRKCIHFFQAE